MGSAPDVYAELRKELQGSDADVLTPDSEGYRDSLKRWSEHCVKEAVSILFLILLLPSDL
jgi:hypothetical protein